MSGGTELSDATRLHVEKAVDSLVEEFGEVQSRETIERLMDDSLRQLAGDAQVDDFVPTLAQKPLSPEVLEAADIVVTMGRSVGAVDPTEPGISTGAWAIPPERRSTKGAAFATTSIAG